MNCTNSTDGFGIIRDILSSPIISNMLLYKHKIVLFSVKGLKQKMYTQARLSIFISLASSKLRTILLVLLNLIKSLTTKFSTVKQVISASFYQDVNYRELGKLVSKCE